MSQGHGILGLVCIKFTLGLVRLGLYLGHIWGPVGLGGLVLAYCAHAHRTVLNYDAIGEIKKAVPRQYHVPKVLPNDVTCE